MAQPRSPVRLMDGITMGHRYTYERIRHEDFIHTWRNQDSDVPFEWVTGDDIQPIAERIAGNTAFRYIDIQTRGVLSGPFLNFLVWLKANVLQGHRLKTYSLTWIRDGVAVDDQELRNIFGAYIRILTAPDRLNVRENSKIWPNSQKFLVIGTTSSKQFIMAYFWTPLFWSQHHQHIKHK